MLRNAETRVERHVAFLAALQADRSAEAHSGHTSALIRSRVQYRVKTIRELMAAWESWQRFGQPPGFQPPQWDEADVFSNVLPWTVASPAHGMTEQHLRYKVYCAAQELQRCQEELRFLPQDAVNTLQYFEWQQQQLSAALQAVNPQLGCAAGRAHMLRTWQARIFHLQQQALDAFVKADGLSAADYPCGGAAAPSDRTAAACSRHRLRVTACPCCIPACTAPACICALISSPHVGWLALCALISTNYRQQAT